MDLLKKMLDIDQKKRINLIEIKKHPYFEGINWNTWSMFV